MKLKTQILGIQEWFQEDLCYPNFIYATRWRFVLFSIPSLPLWYLPQFCFFADRRLLLPIGLSSLSLFKLHNLFSILVSQSNAYSFTSISSLLHYDAFIRDCDKYIPNGPVVHYYFPALVDEFLSSSKIVHQMKTYTNMSSTATTTIPDHYTLLLPSSIFYKCILLEARALVPSIINYNEFILVSNLSIFVSSYLGKFLLLSILVLYVLSCHFILILLRNFPLLILPLLEV